VKGKDDLHYLEEDGCVMLGAREMRYVRGTSEKERHREAARRYRIRQGQTPRLDRGPLLDWWNALSDFERSVVRRDQTAARGMPVC